MRFFNRRRKPATDTSGLGVSLIALRLHEGDVAPAQGTVVIFNAIGHARRVASGRVSCEQGETVFCFHPGPYTVDLMPFASAPEWGLRLRFVVDAANPRVTQQRFDLYLYSEAAERLELAGFGAAVESALQMELAQGALDLPPCTSLEEWHAFRAGLNQLMYTRYGVTVDDCVPVDLGEQIDFADILKARAGQAAEAESLAAAATAVAAVAAATATATANNVANNVDAATVAAILSAPVDIHTLSAPPMPMPPAATPEPAEATVEGPPAASAVPARTSAPREPQSAARQDAQALRRLFIELPALSTELRSLTLPSGLPVFQQHQALLLRLGMASLNVNTMPALAWSAPEVPLEPHEQLRRSRDTLTALAALDEAWSLLARLHLADHQQWPMLMEEADRICANLETGLSLRRAPNIPRTEPSL
jgi:hypothetical protein